MVLLHVLADKRGCVYTVCTPLKMQSHFHLSPELL